MKSGGRGLTDRRERFSLQRLLVVTQVAVSLVLLVGALLFVRSFRNLMTFDPGLRQAGMTVASGFQDSAPPERTATFQRSCSREVERCRASWRRRPHPRAADRRLWGHGITIGRRERRLVQLGEPGLLRDMGMPLLGAGTSGAAIRDVPRVAVVNQAFVREVLRRGAIRSARRCARAGAELSPRRCTRSSGSCGLALRRLRGERAARGLRALPAMPGRTTPGRRSWCVREASFGTGRRRHQAPVRGPHPEVAAEFARLTRKKSRARWCATS